MFDPSALRDALAAVPTGAFSLPSSYRATGVHHGYRRLVLISAGFRTEYAHHFDQVLAEFAPVHDAWISWMDPGAFIAPHRDASPWRERWQVPIIAAGQFGGESVTRPTDGVPFPVTHWRPHWVLNDTDHPRVHIVIDRANFLDLPPAGFELFPIPDVLRGVVDAASTA